MSPVTLVCGFGRCGTSLVMQMLRAGGMRVTGRLPSFEDERASALNFDGPWISRQAGKAVKILDIHRPEILLPEGEYRAIWIDRNSRQQAGSQAKFLRQMVGLDCSRADRRRLAASYIRDRPAALAALLEIGPFMTICFEGLIIEPRISAGRIARFCALPESVIPTMAATVLPRDPEARPDMNIELMLMRRHAHGEQSPAAA